MAHAKQSPRERRKVRIRKRISGTESRPRLSVFRSNRYVYAQIIDDGTGKTLASANSLALDGEGAKSGRKAAKRVGALLAEKALRKQVETVVFDRNGYAYHGVVRELAEGAREGGLKF